MRFRLNIFLFLLALAFGISCSKKEQGSFSFVQLCDTQLGMGGYAHDLKTFRQAVQQINEIKPDFAVICGDLVHNASDSSYADFLDIMESFDIPCHVAPGNHDVGNVPNDSTLSYYRKTIGKDYFDFENKGYSFLITNTQLWKEDVADESQRHNEWVVETLEAQKSKNAPVIVVGHYPLFLERPDEEEEYFNLPPAKRTELLDSFKKNGVVAYLSGHTHELVINDFEGIQFVSGETTSKNFDKRPFGFRVWEVSTDTIQHHFVPLIDADE